MGNILELNFHAESILASFEVIHDSWNKLFVEFSKNIEKNHNLGKKIIIFQFFIAYCKVQSLNLCNSN